MALHTDETFVSEVIVHVSLVAATEKKVKKMFYGLLLVNLWFRILPVSLYYLLLCGYARNCTFRLRDLNSPDAAALYSLLACIADIFTFFGDERFRLNLEPLGWMQASSGRD